VVLICCQTNPALTLALRDITLQPAPAPHVHQVASFAPAKGNASVVQMTLTFYHLAAVQTRALRDFLQKPPAGLASHVVSIAPHARHSRNACNAQTAPTFTTEVVKLPALLGLLQLMDLKPPPVPVELALTIASPAREKAFAPDAHLANTLPQTAHVATHVHLAFIRMLAMMAMSASFAKRAATCVSAKMSAPSAKTEHIFSAMARAPRHFQAEFMATQRRVE